MKWKRFLALPWYTLAKFCLKTVCETHDISSTCRLTYMLSNSSPSLTIQCITDILWPKMLKYIYLFKCFHAVSYIAIKRHVPLPRFSETFSMWCRSIFGTKWHRFHYCCNLWWVQPLYCINTLDYKYFMWIHYERLHNHNKAKLNKTVCIFLGIYCITASSTSCVHKTTRHVALSHKKLITCNFDDAFVMNSKGLVLSIYWQVKKTRCISTCKMMH